MSSIITITVYTLDELSCPARGKARDWYRQHHADSNWYENVYEDFREVCGIFGIDLRQRVFRLSNGRFMEEPCIWFSGFCSQGDGALMNPLMILVKIIKLRWIHILSYDQMVSRKINNQTTRCANSI
ncbi:hypothetical protein NYV42_26610, partial [Escherichia coli]|nr:hypothetical protein [Escherichia coli]